MFKEKIALGGIDVNERSIKQIERIKVCIKNDDKIKIVSNMMLNSNTKGNMINLNI